MLGVGVLYTAIGWPLSNSAQSDFLMYVLFSQWCLYKNCFCHTWVVCLILRCQLRVAGDEAQWAKGRRRKRGEAMSLTYLHVSWESYTHKKSNIWVKKSTSNFSIYLLFSTCRSIKCPFPENLASQNSSQNKDSGKTFKCRSNRRRKARWKKRAGEKDRFRCERDVQILASVNAPKTLLNLSTSNWAVLCCKSLFQPFPYQANWLACITGVRFSGERRQLSPKPERMQARSEWGEPLRGMSGAGCQKAMACGQAVVFSASSPSLSCKNAKKITPVMQATNWLKAGPKRRIWSKGGVFFYCFVM